MHTQVMEFYTSQQSVRSYLAIALEIHEDRYFQFCHATPTILNGVLGPCSKLRCLNFTGLELYPLSLRL